MHTYVYIYIYIIYSIALARTPPGFVTNQYCKSDFNLTSNVQELTLYTRRHEMDTKMKRKSAPEGTRGPLESAQWDSMGPLESTKCDPMGS